MSDEILAPIIIEGREVGKVRLAPVHYDAEKRREINMGLGIVQLPRLLETFQPVGAMAPQERFLRLVRAYCELMNDGQRNQLDANDLAKRYMGTHGILAALHHQVRRANGDAECPVCKKPYLKHKYERAILNPEGHPYIHRLCNGDLVKL
jgi:hypothetical protein